MEKLFNEVKKYLEVRIMEGEFISNKIKDYINEHRKEGFIKTEYVNLLLETDSELAHGDIISLLYAIMYIRYCTGFNNFDNKDLVKDKIQDTGKFTCVPYVKENIYYDFLKWIFNEKYSDRIIKYLYVHFLTEVIGNLPDAWMDKLYNIMIRIESATPKEVYDEFCQWLDIYKSELKGIERCKNIGVIIEHVLRNINTSEIKNICSANNITL